MHLCHRVSIKFWGHYFTPTEFPALGVALTKITFRVGQPSFLKNLLLQTSLFLVLHASTHQHGGTEESIQQMDWWRCVLVVYTKKSFHQLTNLPNVWGSSDCSGNADTNMLKGNVSFFKSGSLFLPFLISKRNVSKHFCHAHLGDQKCKPFQIIGIASRGVSWS